MSENKRYYYLKLKENFFETEEIKILESMPKGIYYSNLLLKLYLRALKYEGAVKYNDCMPYDEGMLAAVTNLSTGIVRGGLKVLSSMHLIEKLEDGTIYMSNIQSFIGKSSSEADRKRLYRNKIEEERKLLEESNETEQGQISSEFESEKGTDDEQPLDKLLPENRDTEIKDKENIDKENKVIELKNRDSISSQSVSLLKSFEKETGLTGGLNLCALKKAVELHGLENVKKAMDIALIKNKPTMTYISGILKNWAKEGYPKEGGDHGNGGISKNTGTGKNEFSGFKPKEPKTISEEERRELELKLI